MSLYNMLFGANPHLDMLFELIGVHPRSRHCFGRVRDGWITEDAKTVCIFHRNYGEEGRPFDLAVADIPTFVAKYYADDLTYGWYEFTVVDDPELAATAQVIADETDNRNCMDKYLELIDMITRGEDNELTRNAIAAGKKIVKGLHYAELEGNADVEHGAGSITITQGGAEGVFRIDSCNDRQSDQEDSREDNILGPEGQAPV